MSDMRFNKKEKEKFLHELENGRLSHAYIVEGEDGVGKYTFAMFAANAILCTGENKPCGQCNGCKKLASGNHPDLFVFGPEKEGSQITVGIVREIKKSVYLLPNEGDKKVYIIRDGQSMNVQAQNALLKFFEEPPASAVFFVLTDKREALLPTVISRGSLITLYPASNEKIIPWLKEKFPKKTNEEIISAVNMCEGCPGKALALLDKRFTQIKSDVTEFADLIFASKKFGTVSFFKSKKYDRIKAKDFLLTLFSLFADVFRAKRKEQKYVLLDDAQAKGYAKLTTDKKLAFMSEETMRSYERIDLNTNINLTLVSFAGKINEIQ